MRAFSDVPILSFVLGQVEMLEERLIADVLRDVGIVHRSSFPCNCEQIKIKIDPPPKLRLT
jgi:hypothetical protein